MSPEESSTQPDPAPSPRPAAHRIFLSSTKSDLEVYRKSAHQAILESGGVPEEMERFSAQPRPPVEECLERVRQSDGLIVVVAHRYGWVPTAQEGGDGHKSLTWIEVEEALRLKKPVWPFLVDSNSTWTDAREQDELTEPGVASDPERFADVAKKVASLAEFKQWLQGKAQVTTADFTTPDDLARKILSSLNQWTLRTPGLSEGTNRPDSLALYRAHLLTVHRDLVPFFSGATKRPLGDIYVDLELEGEACQGLLQRQAGAAGREAAEHVHPKLEQLLRLDPGESDTSGRWVILGDPGAGKSTLCRHLCYTLAEDRKGPVPVLVSLARWARERVHPLALADQDLESTHTEHVPGELRKELIRLGHEPGRLWLLLDGLDEVPTDAGQWLSKALAGLVNEFPGARMALTSRKAGYEPLGDDFHQAEVRPLDKKARRELLCRWLPETGAAVWQRIQSSTALAGLAHNPLLLTLIAKLAGEEGGRLPQTRSEVYARSVTLLLQRGQSDQAGVHAPGSAAAVLPDLSLRLHAQQCESWPRDWIDDQLGETLDADAKLDRRFQRDWNSQDEFLDELAFKSGLLAPRGSPNDPWSYLHRSLREHLAAVGLGKRGDDSWRPHLRAMEGGEEGATHWGETLVMVAGHHPEPDELIAGLAERDPELGLRAFEDAKSVNEETVARLLDRIGDWERRSRIFERLPEKVKDARACLRTLAEVRDRFSKGNDLYFLDQALSKLGVQHPDLGADAEAVRAKLFDHLPRPEESLFRTIRTPDGDKSLWAEIPNGSFLMGSRDGEGDSRERPHQHEVQISKSFQAAIVPVTIAQFRAFDPSHEPHFKWRVAEEELGAHPVENVTWYEAVSFCRWLSSRFEWARGARLPTEAEWEYMCRAGTTSPWWCGDSQDELKDVAWFGKNFFRGTTHPVARKSANPWGLDDVHGNVWEWCQDWYADSYPGTDRRVDPTGPESGSFRVVRGGCFWNVAGWLRSAYRGRRHPGNRFRGQGFRVVLPAARQ